MLDLMSRVLGSRFGKFRIGLADEFRDLRQDPETGQDTIPGEEFRPSGFRARAEAAPRDPWLARARRLLAPFGDAITWSPRQWEDFWGDARAQAIPAVQQAQLMSVIPSSFFTSPDWMTFAPGVRGIQEFTRWALYSYKAYPAAGSVNLLFFDQTEGTATNGRADTNMTDTGKMPADEMFVSVSVGVDAIPSATDVFAVNAANGLAAQQWYSVLTVNAYAVMKISGKEYFVVAPLTRLPPGHGFQSLFTSSSLAANVMNVGYLANGTPDTRSKFRIDPPLGMMPGRTFEWRLLWNALQTVTTAGRIGMGKDGWKIRPVLSALLTLAGAALTLA